MKRCFSILLLLISALSSLGALSYEPSITISTGMRGSELSEDFLRTSALLTLETEIPAIGLDHGIRISMPMGVTLNSGTREFNGLSLHGYLEAYSGLSYDQRITELFGIGLALKGIYRYYPKIDGALFGGSAALNLMFRTTRHMSILIPLELSFLKDEFDYTVSVGTRFTFGGGR